MEHTCSICNYSTKKKFNYDKHIASNKHKLVESKMEHPEKSKNEKHDKSENLENEKNDTCKIILISDQTDTNKMDTKMCDNELNNLKELIKTIKSLHLELELQKKQLNEQKLQIEHIISEIF